MTHPFHDTPVAESATPVAESATSEIKQPLDRRVFGDTRDTPQQDTPRAETVASKLPEPLYEDTTAATTVNSDEIVQEEEAGIRNTKMEAEPGFTEEEADSFATMATTPVVQKSEGDAYDESSGSDQSETSHVSGMFCCDFAAQ